MSEYHRIYSRINFLKAQDPHWWVTRLMRASTVTMNWDLIVEGLTVKNNSEFNDRAVAWMKKLLDDYKDYDDLMLFSDDEV